MTSLEVGAPRIGWLIDGDPSTPLVAVALEDTGTAIRLRIPWSNDANTHHLHRWFSDGIAYGDDPDRVKHSYRPPDHLWFRDTKGFVALVGTRAGASSYVLTAGLGEGTIPIAYAVLDTGPAAYSSINGLRSEIDGLVDWVGLRSLEATRTTATHGRLEGLALALRAPASVALSRRLNLRFQPHYWTEQRPNGDVVVHETVLVESRTRQVRPWIEHLGLHGAVRDLVGVSRWRLGPAPRLWALIDTDQHRSINGALHGDRWAEVRTYRLAAGESIRPADRPLFGFEDVGPAGFRRWQRTRIEFARGINPLLATLNPSNGGLEANLALTCIGLDGIGYQLALAAGSSRTKANAETLATRLRRVASEIPYAHDIDVDEWAQRAADANNGIKHANRDMPDVLTMANTLRENYLIFRLWVAARLRVHDSTIRRGASTDPQFRPYEEM